MSKGDSRTSISPLACWIVGSLNWSATRWACFKLRAALVCARWIKSLIQCLETGHVIRSCLFGNRLHPEKYMFSMQPVGTAAALLVSKIYNFCCSVLFHLALQLECIMHSFISAWIYLFININSECHICDSFEKNIAFSISAGWDLLALVAIVITIPL